MRILFLAPQPFFCERGTPLRARNILRAHSEAGYEVDVLCYPFGANLDLPGVRMFRSPRVPGIRSVPVGPSLAKFPLDALMFLRARALCRRRRYDVIQAVEEAAFFAVGLARRCGARLVYDMDSYISDHLRFSGFIRGGPLLRLAERLEKTAMRAASLVVTVGPTLSDEVRRVAPDTTILQLEDAPAQDRFEADEDGARRLREEFGLGDAPAVVYTGNFASYQGVDLLVQAAGRVAAKRPDIRFVFAGGRPEDIADMRVRALAADAAAVCVFAGTRPAAEIPAFLTLASVLASPRTRGTNPPMKIYPYMQSGRPLVATRVPTHLQVLDDRCAILTAPEPDALAAGVLRAFDDSAGSAILAAAAARRVEEQYTLPIFKEKVRAAFRRLEPNRA